MIYTMFTKNVLLVSAEVKKISTAGQKLKKKDHL